MRARALCVLAATLAALGCDVEPRVVRLTLELPRALGCRPTAVDEVEVRALGDFPTRDPNVVFLDPAGGLAGIDRFPDTTRVVTVEARGSIGREAWIGGGVAHIGESSSEMLVTLLRYGRSCPLSDGRARVPEGAVAVALPDGRLFVAGGHEGGRVLESVVTVEPTSLLAVTSGARFFVDRTGASATMVDGELLVIAGGSSAVDGQGEDTLEIVRVREGVEARAGDGFLARRRREHAAVALGLRRVLVAGGREARGDPPLDVIEVITVEQDGRSATSAVAGRLRVARASPAVLLLEDGSVVIAGGVDATGEPVATIERFDPATGELTASAASLPARSGAALVALAGGRVVQVGGRDGEGWTGRVEVFSGDVLMVLGAIAPVLEDPIGAALPNGRVLVIGRDPIDRRARGVVIDPGSAALEPVEVSRVASALVRLRDGSFAEGDADGLSTLRLDVRTPFDALPATLAPAFMDDRRELALDAPGRWRAEGGTLRAELDGARFDVPGLRFASFALELDASGEIELLLVREGARALAVSLAQDGVELAGCRASRADGAALRLTRAGDRVVLDAGAGAVECSVALPERVGIAVRARAGAGVRRLAIARL